MTTEIDISKAQSITGWMGDTELSWLAMQAKFQSVIVEIGSYVGRSTRALADNTPGVVYAVDNWFGPEAGSNSKPHPNGQGGSSGIPWSDEDRQNLIIEFRSNLADHIATGKVIVCQCDHADAGRIDVNPTMVFIDGSHTLEAVERDINIWWNKLLPGGILCGHDGNQWPVITPVRETFPDVKLVSDTTIWVVRKGLVQ